MRQTMDLLNLHQPWDCQRFPKSKTICYGGGGGGGGSATDVVNKVTNEAKKVAKGDVSVKKQGTASGAESTIKKSDLGKVVHASCRQIWIHRI